MRELRRLESSLIDVFESSGYGEVATPTIEYHEVLARGDERGAPAAYRFFDERGELLAMRSDMTIPIARLISGRFAAAEPPFRFFYVGNAYRAIRPQRGQMREFTQAGIELVGAEAPAGDGAPAPEEPASTDEGADEPVEAQEPAAAEEPVAETAEGAGPAS
jgi:ATP phosphoribosyltransferase regulatory subunit HisZ